ncbi:MAG: ABC transporter ATP-binding protein/permease, partial [Bacteroidetes bacterium]|nr:ABC transporter ATP-binding protein/permease [Bacteroidota bacterium]
MRSLYTLKKYFIRHKKKLLWGFAFILLSNISSVYVPIIIRDSIDDLQKNISSDALVNYALLIVGVTFFSGFFRFLIRQTIIVSSRLIEFDMRNDFWEHLQKLPMKFFQNTKTGDIMAHVTNDINAVRNFFGPAVMYSVDTATTFVLTIAIMISIDPVLTLLSLVPFPILSILVYKLGKKIHKRFTAIQEHFSVLTAKAQENLSGIRIVKAYVREAFEVDSFRKLSLEYFQKNMKLVKIQAFFFPLMFMIIGTSMIIIMWFGGVMVIEEKLSLGEIIAFILYLGYLIWPAIAFGWVTNIVQQAAASQKRLNTILHVEPEIADTSETDSSITEITGTIEFRNVTFRYRENLEPALENINLKIPAGSTLAIVGYTGSGKSTLVNLIPRLHTVTEGQLLIDGKKIDTIPLGLLRENIGYVPQETFLFSDTIGNNIGYGLEEIDEMKIVSAAEISHLVQEIEEFPKGFETIVGERGITLSGGQKQRTTIARAIVKNPKILILDDCLSAVDTNTEELILKNFRQIMEQRTSIIISHRISTVKDADKIIVLNNKKIAEEGTHDELIAQGGIYAELYTKQLLEKELEEI